jgi:hypothetical protein
MGVLLATLPAPRADRLRRQGDPAFEQLLFTIATAETEPEGQPDTVADDLYRAAVVLIAVR